MKYFKTIDELHAYLERKAKKIVKHYYTDWKNIDRPYLMKLTGERTSEVYVIFRDCGTYLYSRKDLDREFPQVIMDYYKNNKGTEYYKIDLYRLTAEKIESGLPKHIKRIEKTA